MFVISIALTASTVPVKSATIFQSSAAELTRGLAIGLKVSMPPISYDPILRQPDLVRTSGVSRDVRVLDVVYKRKPNLLFKTRREENSPEIRELVSKCVAIEAEQQVLRQEAALLDESAGLATKPQAAANGRNNGVAIIPDRVLEFLEKFVQRKMAANRALQSLDDRIADLEDKLSTLRNDHKGKLVSAVTWRPFYDLHATTSTGEEWNNLTLTLSAASSQAQQQQSVPPLNPLKLTAVNNLDPPNPPPSSQGRAGLSRTSGFAATQEHGCFRAAEPIVVPASPSSRARRASRSPTRTALEEEHTDHAEALPLPSSPTRSPLSVAYRVEGDVSVPSDGEEHKLTVALLNFKAELKYVCVPRRSPTVYIVSKVKNASEYDLLAGTMNVFMNDGFVTKTSIGLIAADERFDYVFGKIEYEPRRSFAEPQKIKTTTRTTLTTVKNQHKFDIAQLAIRDAIPLGSETDKIVVVLRKPPGLAEAKEGQEVVVQVDADGDESEKAKAKVRWSEVVDGQGGEKDGLFEITLESQWDTKSPGEIRWTEQATQQEANEK
ncbi:hypothetical protein BD414DRAFT_512864 [Trametes punicea]|nr:hypothetical protein BD414DRAFT_512864 [Trametes punicea]